MRTVLAVDLGGTKTAVGIVDSYGRILAKTSAPTPLGDPGAAVALIAGLARDLADGGARPEAAGLALPGLVERRSGILRSSPSSGWKDVPFTAMVAKALGLETRSDNDVRACAWAESRFGSGLGLDSFFWMTVSTGVGGAVYAKGAILEGASAMAGEIGHLVVNPGGERCGCGNQGCLEAEAAGPAWRRKALRLLDSGISAGIPGGGFLATARREAIDARLIAEGARAGDAICQAVVAEASTMLARGLAAVYNILDPEAVVLGGGVAGALDLILPIVAALLPGLTVSPGTRRTRLGPSALGYDAALVGAAALALFPEEKEEA